MQRRVLCVLLVVVVGCRSWRNVPLAEIPQRIGPGDKVRTLTKTGEKATFVVVQVTSTMVAGESYRVFIADLEKLEERRFSVVKTGLFSAGAIVTFAVLAAFATAAAVAIAFGA